MTEVRAAGPYPLPGVKMQTWIVRYDQDGGCCSPETRKACIDDVSAAGDRPVILFSHGWNNDFSDAEDLYSRFLVEFEKIQQIHPLKGGEPIFIGVTWPSIWLPLDKGPKMSADPTGAFGGAAKSIEKTISDPADRARFHELIGSGSLNLQGASDLARLISPILRGDDDEGPPAAAADEASVLASAKAIEQIEKGEDDDDFDRIRRVDGPGSREPSEAAAAGYSLDPKNVLRLASLYLMKGRAGTVGSKGVSSLLADILKTRASLHLVGHSFGCKVLLSALAESDPPSRKVGSILLLQPAISHLAFADTIPGREGPGGYRNVFAMVEGPIFCTYSAHDFPLHDVYHHAMARKKDVGEIRSASSPTSAGAPPNNYAALGGYGPRTSGEKLLDPIPNVGEPHIVDNGASIVGLDGSAGRRIDGHGGVANVYTAWALRSQMT
ncbi:hypothetical protein JIR23_14290 [Bradyrhizobium diazoefficiens]|nr:hypothetical protein [Bradyrhizobium diazoefficiens]QQN66764.1 hypothetical protein JIR23_14290 [Bradyrhizobium diazoefficiens]